MSELVLFLVPAAAGAVLTLALRTIDRRAGLYAALIGLVIAACFVIHGYSVESTTEDGWGMSFVVGLVGMAYMFWLVGVGVAAALGSVVAQSRQRSNP
jgi:hypothetical protein